MQKILEEIYSQFPQRVENVSAGLEPAHAQDTLRWALTLKPDASIPLQIAALTHDIDRIVSEWSGYGGYHQGDIENYRAYKATHAKRSADFIAEKMRSENFPDDLIKRVEFLIACHDDQTSDDPEAKILQTADALSYFSVFLKQSYQKLKGDISLKVKFMLAKIPQSQRVYLREISMPQNLRKILKKAEND